MLAEFSSAPASECMPSAQIRWFHGWTCACRERGLLEEALIDFEVVASPIWSDTWLLRQKQTGDGFSSPASLLAVPGLIHFIFFNAVARVDILQREDDHASRRGGCDADDDDLTDGAARQVTHVNHWPV